MSLTVPQPIHDALDDTSLEPFIPVSQLPPLAAPSATPSVPSIATTSPQSSVEDLPAATPTHDGCHGGAWVFSPPAQPPSRKPSARKSSVSSFFCFANTPTEASQHEKDQNDRRRLQRLHQIPENDAFSSSRRRRRRKTPLILLGSVLLFGVVATVLLVSKGDSSNANLGDMVNATAAPRGMPDAIDNTQTPANASLPNNPAETPIGVDEDVYGWGRGDGTNVRWSKYRFYFVNKCSFPLHLYQKYRDDSRNWSFCQVPVGSYGCPNNRDGAYLHTPHAGHDQATLFEITVQSAMGTFYDISIIPPGCTGDMLSLAMCKNQTGKVGFNVAMAVTPLHSICVPLTCYADACPDAYHFPKDDGKNHGCVSTDAIYQVTFCPPVR